MQNTLKCLKYEFIIVFFKITLYLICNSLSICQSYCGVNCDLRYYYLRIVYNMLSPFLSLLLLILLPLFTLRIYLTICDGFINCSSACNMQHNLATALLIFFLLLCGFVIAAAATAAVIIVVVVAKQP